MAFSTQNDPIQTFGTRKFGMRTLSASHFSSAVPFVASVHAAWPTYQNTLKPFFATARGSPEPQIPNLGTNATSDFAAVPL